MNAIAKGIAKVREVAIRLVDFVKKSLAVFGDLAPLDALEVDAKMGGSVSIGYYPDGTLSIELKIDRVDPVKNCRCLVRDPKGRFNSIGVEFFEDNGPWTPRT